MAIRHPDDILGGRVQRLLRTYSVPACSLACITDGRPSWKRAFGTADDALGVDATTNTSFQVASLSKIVTAWAALKLVALGRIDLDEPVEPHLRRWRFAASPMSTQSITLRALLSHTAGLPSAGSDFYRRIEDVPSLEQALSAALDPTDTTVEIDRGTRFRYSNPGYAVVELLIEELNLFICLPDRGDGLVALTNSNTGMGLIAHVAIVWLRKIAGEPLKLHRLVRLRKVDSLVPGTDALPSPGGPLLQSAADGVGRHSIFRADPVPVGLDAQGRGVPMPSHDLDLRYARSEELRHREKPSWCGRRPSCPASVRNIFAIDCVGA